METKKLVDAVLVRGPVHQRPSGLDRVATASLIRYDAVTQLRASNNLRRAVKADVANHGATFAGQDNRPNQPLLTAGVLSYLITAEPQKTAIALIWPAFGEFQRRDSFRVCPPAAEDRFEKSQRQWDEVESIGVDSRHGHDV